ncbi:hypothetical protein BDN72DRAFT_848776 [Pluteus cervinus]|uniref:Uncharacterized protein n=1 Tax=Pluteus cervinus TaxID=181527 RepID=A0ACD3A9S0_9AGAR|nr:hypothetical protein BDN72DRAFT_848776 [Pluteus cervinus]
MKLWELDLRERFRGVLLPENDVQLPVLPACWVDVSQDLLIVHQKVQVNMQQLKLHFLSLTTGKEHPLAFVPTYTTPFYNSAVVPSPHFRWETRFWSYSVEIYGQHMAISLQWDELPQIVVINWKTGDVLEKWTTQFDFFAFLDAHTLLLAKGYIRPSQDTPTSPNLKIFDLRSIEYVPPHQPEASGLTTVQLIHSGFSIPIPLLRLNLSRDVGTFEPLNIFTVKSGRSGTGSGTGKDSSLEPLFVQNPRCDIVTIELNFFVSTCPRFIITSVGPLLEFVAAKTASRLTPLVTQEFALHEWPNCEFPHPGHSQHAPISVSGSRLLIPLKSHDGAVQRVLELFDFNTRPWRRELGDDLEANDLLPTNLSAHVGFPVPHMRKIITPNCTGSHTDLTEDQCASFVLGIGSNTNIGQIAIHRTDDVEL